MTVDVHRGADVLVSEVFLGYLDIHSLHQHNGCAKMSKIMESTLRYTGLMILDEEYGYDRDWEREGGYSILVDSAEDVEAIKPYVDFDKHPPEWVTSISYTKIISALFIMNNDFSIMVYVPQEIAPQVLLNELED